MVQRKLLNAANAKILFYGKHCHIFYCEVAGAYVRTYQADTGEIIETTAVLD